MQTNFTLKQEELINPVYKYSMLDNSFQAEEGSFKFNGGEVVWTTDSTENIIKILNQHVIVKDVARLSVEKLSKVYYAIQRGEHPKIETPVAKVSPITISDISATQIANKKGSLFDLFGIEKPWSTGDKTVDSFLLHQNTYNRRFDVQSYDNMEVDIIARIKELEDTKSGDLGKNKAEIIKGQHAALGACLAKESYIFVKKTE